MRVFKMIFKLKMLSLRLVQILVVILFTSAGGSFAGWW